MFQNVSNVLYLYFFYFKKHPVSLRTKFLYKEWPTLGWKLKWLSLDVSFRISNSSKLKWTLGKSSKIDYKTDRHMYWKIALSSSVLPTLWCKILICKWICHIYVYFGRLFSCITVWNNAFSASHLTIIEHTKYPIHLRSTTSKN